MKHSCRSSKKSEDLEEVSISQLSNTIAHRTCMRLESFGSQHVASIHARCSSAFLPHSFRKALYSHVRSPGPAFKPPTRRPARQKCHMPPRRADFNTEQTSKVAHDQDLPSRLIVPWVSRGHLHTGPTARVGMQSDPGRGWNDAGILQSGAFTLGSARGSGPIARRAA